MQKTLENPATVYDRFLGENGFDFAKSGNILFANQSGCGTTVALHYLLYRMLQKDPDIIPWVCDRKYFVDTESHWDCTWSGLPVYRSLDSLLVNRDELKGNMHFSVYSEPNPDVLRWLQPVYELLIYRMENKVSDDPYMITGDKIRRRRVIVIIDDLDTLMNSLDGSDSRAVVKILNEIVVSGRSLGIHLWVGSHGITSQAVGLSSVALSCMYLMLGKSLIGDGQIFSWSKREYPLGSVEGVKHLADRDFVTPFKEVPYLPAPNLERGLLDVVIPELSKHWHEAAPVGYVNNAASLSWQNLLV